VTTSIATVCAALVTHCDTVLADTQVIDGPADTTTTLSGRVLTVGARIIDATREQDSMTLAALAEIYTVEMVHSVTLVGADTLDDAVTQALADYAAVEESIRKFAAGPDLGLDASGVLQVFPAAGFEVEKFAIPEGRSASVRWGVRVYAQVT
jgi:hypothetical protein